jgi:capsular polysaccharide transport system permease protein
MSDDARSRPGRPEVVRKRDTVSHVEAAWPEIERDVAAPLSWPRPEEEPSGGGAGRLGEIGDRVFPAARRSPLTLPSPRLKGPPAGADVIRSLPRLKISPRLASFIGCVVVPAFAATVYFAFIASNQPAAEARFAVHQTEMESTDSSEQTDNSSNNTSSSSNNMNAQTAGFSFSVTGQNAYIVTSYIRSRAIVDDLNGKMNLRDIFRRPEADFWARLRRNATVDQLTEYWNSMVDTYIDAPSGIVTLRVRAFRPDDAVAVAKAVLDLSEALVNRISDRARRDEMAMSEREVRRAYETTQAALAALQRFQDSSGIINPVQAGTEVSKLLAPLLGEKVRLESDLFVASRDLADSAPTVQALKNRIESVERQIVELKGRLTGSEGAKQTIAASLAKFEELDLQRQFAEKMYALAQTNLDRARIQAARQNVYLTVFVPPSLPEESRYPRRVAFPMLIFVGLAIVWSVVVMIIAAVEDHRL